MLDDPSRESICEHCEREFVLKNAELEVGSFTCPRCKKTSRVAKLPAEVPCPTCKRNLALDKEERFTGTFSCSYCRLRSGARLPAELRCPSCRKQLRLDANERATGAFTCPFCRHEVQSDLAAPPPPAQMIVAGKMTEELIQRRARQDLLYGVVITVLGAGITVGTLLMGQGKYILAYGPIAYGIFRIVRGASAYKPLPKPPKLPRAIATLREPDDPTS